MFQLPNDCRLYTKLQPALQWGWREVLLNKATYLLETIVWQNATPNSKGKIAQHKRKQPKPYVPDFMKIDQPKGSAANGVEAHDIDDIKTLLSIPRG